MEEANTIAGTNARAPFFRRIDWASFWTATIISFVVYFLTLSPSVSLEDSGELAVAGDHLGVPHPPGYPIWTMISFVFARIFSFVTFRGQPTPAWSIALASAVMGALAAGCTSMLITRSASDMLRTAHKSIRDDNQSRENLICWAGGVAGSLIFAFSPVMWSQSTIVEVYALGAFFLMLVMLLTYRWMRQPSDKLLWLTAFVFGLGLTNYQVLLLAALPLVIIIFLRNIAMFRDFVIILIPFGLAALLLKIGSEPVQAGLDKQTELTGELALPNNALCVAALAVAALAFIFVLVWPRIASRMNDRAQANRMCFNIAVSVFAVSVFLMFLGGAATHPGKFTNAQNIALIAPSKYVYVAALLLAIVGVNAVSAVLDDGKWSNRVRWPSLGASAVIFLIMFFMILSWDSAPHIPTAGLEPDKIYPLDFYIKAILAGIVLMIGLAATTERGIYFAVPVASVLVAVLQLTAKGAMMGLTHPSTWWFWAPVAFNFLILLLGALALPNGRSVSLAVLCAELGVSFYAYMPISSDVRNPPMNWGYPRTWEGFKHAITRGQYEKISPTSIFAPKFIKQIGSYFTDLRTQFTLLIAPFGFLPFAAWRFQRKADDVESVNRKFVSIAVAMLIAAFFCWGIDGWVAASAISDSMAEVLRTLSVILMIGAIGVGVYSGVRPLRIAAAFTVIACVCVVIGIIPSVEKIVDMTRIDKLAIGGLLLTGLAGGAMLVYRQIEEPAVAMIKSRDRSTQVTVSLVLAGILVVASAFVFKTLQALLVWNKVKGKCGGNAEEAVAQWDKLSSLFMSEKSIVFVSALCAVVIVALAVYALHFVYRRQYVSVALDNVTQQWLIGTFCNFFVMSFVLIVLANPKGDIQDSFIQKVKFISSHGLFALWIGYGLVFALVVVKNVSKLIFGGDDRRLAPAGNTVFAIAVCAVLATSLIPIHENYFNEQLVFELGGAEQNGHDYGWQFGNYQLRGADAITEELESDEEPLPNPSYPPPMGQGAVFFGGTDPGRFVPTYMIYSADVRPDVFLITQNALADNTFMSTTRDLYGDQLWIPTPDDSAKAFEVYVDEVQSGKRPNNADLIIEHGRVQVVGALGVMEINGILCDMIFKHNKQWHDFYVEESYVIPWMYPYLTPHGLIMKINSEKTMISQTNTDDDMDFWDWYTRRITRDQKYRRDIVAQKSFSKLRSAIAGLYMARGKFRESEEAYAEARMLYPISPEANFRMIQDVLLRQGRYDEALEYVDYFCRKDPNNDRGPMFRKFITDTLAAQRKIEVLLMKYPDGVTPSLEDAVELASCYREVGMNDKAVRVLQSVVSAPGMSVGNAYDLALLARDMGDARLAASFFNRIAASTYVRSKPECLRQAYRIYGAAGDCAKMSTFVDLYLEKVPKDWNAWIDCATLACALGNDDKAERAVENAIYAGREEALKKIEPNPQLFAVAERVLTRLKTRAATPSTPGGF